MVAMEQYSRGRVFKPHQLDLQKRAIHNRVPPTFTPKDGFLRSTLSYLLLKYFDDFEIFHGVFSIE